MSQTLRFGRRLGIPSKRQIIHEMRVLQAEEERRKAEQAPHVYEDPPVRGMAPSP